MAPSDVAERFERVTGVKAHHYLRRGLGCEPAQIDRVLDLFEAKRPFYLFLNITPKPEAKSAGLNVTDMFTLSFFSWLQNALGGAPLVLQVADDLAFLSQDKGKIAEATELGRITIQQVLSCGFNLDQTFAFLNTERYASLYPALVPVQKQITFGEGRKLLNIDLAQNIGLPASLATRAVCSAPRAIPDVIRACDAVAVELCMSDSAFEREFAALVGKTMSGLGVASENAPSALFAPAFPPIHGDSAVRMGIKAEIPAIFTADTAKKVKQKINKYAFSGGGATVEEQRANGANLEVDMSFQWLTLVLADDDQLAHIERTYGSGEMMTGECKAELIKVVQDNVAQFVSRKEHLTQELLAQSTTPRALLG